MRSPWFHEEVADGFPCCETCLVRVVRHYSCILGQIGGCLIRSADLSCVTSKSFRLKVNSCQKEMIAKEKSQQFWRKRHEKDFFRGVGICSRASGMGG